MNRRSKDAIVVGGGVSGLTTAVCLADAGHSVRVWAADPAVDTTSYAAGAIYSPFLIADERASEWAEHTFAELKALAVDNGDHGSETGVAMVFGREVCRDHASPPIWATRVPDFRPCDKEELPRGFASGWSYTVPLVDMPAYLRYLQRMLADRGVTIERRRIASLAEAAADASVVANCTGLGARELVPDESLHPIRGELLVVPNPGIDSFVAEHADTDRELTYLLPHRDVVVWAAPPTRNAGTAPPTPTSRPASWPAASRSNPAWPASRSSSTASASARPATRSASNAPPSTTPPSSTTTATAAPA
jgi:D-amino-acid oxidase